MYILQRRIYLATRKLLARAERYRAKPVPTKANIAEILHSQYRSGALAPLEQYYALEQRI